MRAARYLVVAVIAWLGAGAGSQALAHHAFEAEFDTASEVSLNGKITAIDWVNPHSTLTLTVSEPGRPPQDWKILAGSPNALRQRGICRVSVPVGTEVNVTAYLGKDKSCLRGGAPSHPTCLVAGKYLTFPKTQTFVDIYSSGSYSVYSPENTLCRANPGD